MQKKSILIVIGSLFVFTNIHAQENYWQQFVHYTMDVTLIPGENALRGEESIEYHNNSPDTLYKFYLYLYPNAYRDNETLRARESSQFFRKLISNPEDGGYIEIESFRIASLSDTLADQPLAAFQINDTILAADLPTPLPPGGKMKIELSFYHKVRKFSGRAGYRGSQYDFAQWYPKVCVYDETGWNAVPFHLIGEFYGEFGTFDVTINTPYEYIIGATGELVGGDPGWELVKVDTSLSNKEWQKKYQEIQDEIAEDAQNGKARTARFHAEKVHDFAWLTSPDFLYESGEWDGIPIHVLYRAHVKRKWSKIVVERGARALEWLDEKFGRYPYPQLSLTHGLLGGGMEYPMLVMNSSENEGLIVHEVGHIYFFGILGNNEWKEAWLDEGFTSFQTRWYRETRYGKWGFDYAAWFSSANWLQKRRPRKTSREGRRDNALFYINSGHNEPISRISYQYKDGLGYRVNAYTKGAFFFDMLKYVVGDSTFGEICHEYFDRWKFKHVNEARFKQVCEDVGGTDLTWFFNQWLHDSVAVDYALGKVDKKKNGDSWQTEVEIKKKKRGVMPVDVQLTTASGDTLVKRWQGFEQVGKVTFTTNEKPDKIILDPNDAILDNTRFNNGSVGAEFMFEYPNMNYVPRHAYLFTWRPSGWYNEVDKVRIGGRIKGRQGTDRNFYLGLWFGADSQELDARASYSKQIPILGAGARGSLLFQKMEGRLELDARLNFLKRKRIIAARQHRFWVGFNHSQLVGDNARLYTLRRFDQSPDSVFATWQDGDVNKLYFGYSVNPRGMKWFSNVSVGLETVQKDWGSDFTYTTIFTDLKFWLPTNNEGLFVRFYGKKTSSSTPVQDLIFLDGANPRQRFNRFYLRSDGGIPTSLHYHLPGGGNLSGYYNNPIVGDEIIAFNFELRKQINQKFISGFLRKFFGSKTMVAFFDVASMDLFNIDIFMDAGVGLRFRNFLPDNWYTIFTGGRNLTLRVDFPVWVNEPLPGEDNFRFRWVFGFEQAF